MSNEHFKKRFGLLCLVVMVAENSGRNSGRALFIQLPSFTETNDSKWVKGPLRYIV